MKTYKRTLSIAGSDPSGGAGIQADLKTMSACGCYAATAITAVVDENTVGVTAVHPIPVNFVIGQINSVLDDIGADAVKIGMLSSAELIGALKECLFPYKIKNIVLDPVMVATSGDRLIDEHAAKALKEVLIPAARVITPNLPEAEVLLDTKITNPAQLPEMAKRLSLNGNVSVMLKAGHLHSDVLTDIFYNAETDEVLRLESKRVDTNNTHGTGCTLSSAIASFLARGFSLNDAIRHAKDYINQAIIAGADYQIGHGHGPVNHFYNLWK